MSLSNEQIASIFDTCADMLQLKGESVHRWMSYRRGAETIRETPRSLQAIADENKLTDLPGIGKILAEKISEMLETGSLEFFEQLKEEVPMGVVDMMRVNGVGPKKAALFWNELGIISINELEAAAKAEKLRALSGMGKKSEQKILDGIESLKRQQTDRIPIGVALPMAEALLKTLLEHPESIKGDIAGSIRRGRPTIGDVDILIASNTPQPIMETFINMPQVARLLGHGDTKSSVELQNGLQVDLRILEEARYGTALQYFSGSQQHNIRVRKIALENGYSLNEHALTPVDENGELQHEAAVYCDTEEKVYETIGLPWIAPELREDQGEIEAAREGLLPNLITLDDMRADLHMHTTWSDGKFSIHEMAEAAREHGYQYIVITDHSRSLGIANGLSIERLMQQQEEIRDVNDAMGDDFHIFHGTEMDINADGSLDYPDEILEKLDFVIASLHVSLRQDRETITQRLLNAINNPHVDLIGHPRAQLIGKREPADLDMDAVFDAASKSGVAMEINANPWRLDLEAQYARRAIELGIPISINTDAHSIEDMDLMRFGIHTARRGWLTAENVINTWTLKQFQEWIGKRGN